jgi:hypothetical protein
MTRAKRENKMTVSWSPLPALVALAASTRLPPMCFGMEASENSSLRKMRVESPKRSLERWLSSDQDMEDIWEMASRIARKELETYRLLRYSPDFSMSMPSEDMPSRPPAPRPSQPPNPSPTTVPGDCLMGRNREQYIFDQLTPITPEDVLNDPSTPQGMAFDYLANDDPALTDPCVSETIAQRYGLTTFYFSTQGANWTDNTGWLGEDQECTWLGVACGNSSEAVVELVLRK